MSDTQTIYHVCRSEEWQAARQCGTYGGSTQDAADGFIHFSTAAQVAESVAKHRAGQDGLVLLAVDPQACGEALKWEPSRGGQLFPHLYGSLNPLWTRWVRDLPLDDQGHHIFPPLEP